MSRDYLKNSGDSGNPARISSSNETVVSFLIRVLGKVSFLSADRRCLV